MRTLVMLAIGAIIGLILGASFWIMEWNYTIGALYVFTLMALTITYIWRNEK